MNVRTRWCMTAVLVAMAATLAYAGVEVKPDKDNVVASKLEGEWSPDEAVNQRLGVKAQGKMVFKSDPAVAAKVPEKYDKFLKGKQVYLAGVMTKGEADFPFVLIEHKGNPHLVYFRAQGGDPMGDAESFNL
jgi:hypothetical protein